jgi:hypothetical protein
MANDMTEYSGRYNNADANKKARRLPAGAPLHQSA